MTASTLPLFWIKALLVLATATVAGWLVVTNGVASMTKASQPALALQWLPSHAEALGARSYEIVQGGVSAPRIARARDYARRALEKDATIVDAVRTLGLIASVDNDGAAAQRLFQYSEQLSRRDLATQLWLIESRVAENDVAGALKHFDTALRVSRLAPAILFPVLISAIEDDALVDPVVQMLRADQKWKSDFLHQLIFKGTALENVAAIILRTGDRYDSTKLLVRLVSEGEYDLAWSAYQRATPANNDALVRHGDFEKEGDMPPFDWELANSDQAIASRSTVNGNVVLSFHADGGLPADVARQLLRLPAGRYTFASRAGDIAATRNAKPLWTIRCTGSEQRDLLTLVVDTAQRPSARFTIPDRCAWQWLTLEVSANDAPVPITGWVDDVAIKPLL